MKDILETYLYIADSPVSDFPEFDKWSKRILNLGYFAKKIPFAMVKVIIGQQILYILQLQLIGLTVDVIYGQLS